MPHWPNVLDKRYISPGLSRTEIILKKLDNPHLKIKNIIHVAGTNGKGSTTAFIREMLEQSDYSVNCFNTPALISFNEEIILSGTPISDKKLFNVLERCRVTNCEVTFYEGIAAAAMLAFSENPTDFTILETGLGGRLDSTNVVNPIISIITKVSFDHCEFLGSTIESIASEKAGIIKEKVPIIIAKQEYKKALDVIKNIAYKKHSPVYCSGEDQKIQIIDNQSFNYTLADKTINLPRPNILGDHQIDNASNAITALYLLKKMNFNKITDNAITCGIEKAYWPGRLEKIENNRILKYFENKNIEIFFDGAHNPDGAYAIKNWLKERKAILIVGFTLGKDFIQFLKILKAQISKLCAVSVLSEPKSIKAQEIIQRARKELNIVPSTAYQNIREAIQDLATKSSKTEKMTIIICGSLFLYRDLYELQNNLI
ncbi:bifunctional folylpolyglutamate synthase/dihydrofolate synthase [Anaplasmataceae bacterium AB001_6]|nr:bifunctional folylpolyglutamate synthase/dihydrofolate synthase [Anaplasmataceae bacterium AB001_6]